MTKILLPPAPPIKKAGERKQTKARINNRKAKVEAAVNGVVEELENGTVRISVDAPKTDSMEFIKEVHTKARELLATKEENIIFKANEGPQTDFLAATEKEVFYGGARGGGKTYSMLVDPLRYCSNPNARGLFIRRTMPELRDIIFHTHKIYPRAFPGAKWTEQDKVWRFPSGARIEFGYCEHPKTDVLRYQGQAYSWIGIDELPQFPEAQILNDLRGSLRTVDSRLPTYMRSTGNPGGVGGAWVKSEFIDPAIPGTPFEIKINMPDGSEHTITKRFIPAKVYDNPYLLHNKDYVAMLATLPEVQRRQWLEGDWDAWEGSAFTDFDRKIHVIEPFDIPKTWTRFRGADYGYTSPGCVLWLAVDYDGNIYVYREFYAKGYNAEEFAREVLVREANEPIRYGVLDSSVWHNRGDIGPSIAETMIRAGCRWTPADRSRNSRIASKMQVHQRLRVNPITGKPSMFIFNTCVNLIRTLPMLPIDENNPEDVDTKAEDHAYDALRYALMTRPMKAEISRDIFGSIISRSNQTQSGPADRTFGY